MGSLFLCESYELIEFARAWSDLGQAVQGQVEEVLDQGEAAEVNPAAIKMAHDKLHRLNEEIAFGLELWLDEHGGVL